MAQLTVEMCDSLTGEHIEALNKANIWTVNDLCSNDIMEIKRETNIKYYILKNLVDQVKQRYTLACYDCAYVVDSFMKDLRICPTGVPELTRALDGGYQTQEIVEVSGDSATGKTEMCYLLCGTFLNHFDTYHILYVASQSDFDADKVTKYTRAKAGGRELSDEDIFGYLQRVSVARPTRLADLVHLLNTIVHGDQRNAIRCIIIDSISFITQDDILELGTSDVVQAREAIEIYLSEVMRILTNIAINKNVILFITNSNHSQLSQYKSWTNGIDHRIHLTDNPRRATILKTIHSLSKINYSIPFEINDESLFAVRFFQKPQKPSSRDDDNNTKPKPED